MRNNDLESLEKYYRVISTLQSLSPSEEREQVELWQKARDSQAHDRLVKNSFKLVVQVAWEFNGSGIALDDLVQQGSLGLLVALERFESERGLRISTYAVWWVRAAIKSFLLENKGQVHFAKTDKARRIFFRLSRARSVLAHKNQDSSASVEDLAKEVGVSVGELQKTLPFMEQYNVSFDALVRGGGTRSLAEVLGGVAPSAEEEYAEIETQRYRKKLFLRAFKKLDPREQYVIKERCLGEKSATLREVGEQLGISRERARQLEARAIRKVKSLVDLQEAGRR
jgi:RNA polymerase sigma-32 factor